MSLNGFAFSLSMQIICLITSAGVNFTIMFSNAWLTLKLYGEKTNFKHQAIFALFAGVLISMVWNLSIYFLGGLRDFNYLVMQVVTTSNPLMALAYYLLGKKVLKLSSTRSLRIMSYFYLYYLIVLTLVRVTVLTLLPMPAGEHNYFIDTVQQLIGLAIAVVVALIASVSLKKRYFFLILSDNLSKKSRKDLPVFFLKALVLYCITVFFPLLIESKIIANILVIIILIIAFFLYVYIDLRQYASITLSNKDAYIDMLSKSIGEFHGVKHDFYNILHTYSGYIELGNLDKLKEYHTAMLKTTLHAGQNVDLAGKMPLNPPLVSLISSKIDYALDKKVDFRCNLRSDLSDMNIENIDLCRALSGVLDNAIELAACSEEKSVMLSIEEKSDGSKLIVVTNSSLLGMTAEDVRLGRFTKNGQDGAWLNGITAAIAKYANFSFDIAHYNERTTVFLQLRQKTAGKGE